MFDKKIFHKNYLGHKFELYLKNILLDYYKCTVCGIRIHVMNYTEKFYSSEQQNTDIPVISCEEYIIKQIIE